MAIREITYTLSPSGISPAAEQFGGVQGDHRATKLTFKFNGDLIAALNAYNNLHYRFDAYDGEGNVCQTEGELTSENSLEYFLEERLTRAGGKVAVVLVCTQVNYGAETALELYNFPALLRLKNKPQGNGETSENRESYTTLLEAAKNAAEQAKLSENNANDSANRAAKTAEDIATTALGGKMDKFGEVTETTNEIKIKLNALKENGFGKKLIIQSAGGHCEFCINEDVTGNSYFRVGDSVIESQVGLQSWYFGKTVLRNIGEPADKADATTKGYVDNLILVSKVEIQNDLPITCENNTEYEGTGVSSLSLNFPDTDFICSLYFTTAAGGTININFPKGTKFIGGRPTFSNDETWELNIKNGVVVGGKVE